MTNANDNGPAASVPRGWTGATLEDVLAEGLRNGRSVPTGEGFPVLRLTAIQNGRIELAEHKLGQWSGEDAADYVVEAGDFLISRGNGSIRLVGRGGVVAAVPFPVAFPDTMIRVRPRSDEVDTRFLAYQWDGPQVRGQIERAAKTTAGIHKVNQGDLRKTQLVVPPLSEQRRIVAEIDKHFTRLDAAVATLERVRANLQRARASVLKAAVEGRLVPTEASVARAEGRPYETGAALLQRVLEARRAAWDEAQAGASRKRKYKEPEEPETEGLPELPEGWCWASVEAVGEVKLGRQRSPKDHSGTHMRPYLRVANVYEDRFDLTDVKEMNFTDDEYEVYGLRDGDVLLNEGQSPEWVGRPAIWREQIPGACFQNTLVRFRAYGDVMPEYALLVFRAQMRMGRYLKIAKITTNIAHLGAGRFAAVEFPLPPIAEQRRIVLDAEKHLSMLDAVEAIVRQSATRCERVRQAILKRAFGGRLVEPEAEAGAPLLAAEPSP